MDYATTRRVCLLSGRLACLMSRSVHALELALQNFPSTPLGREVQKGLETMYEGVDDASGLMDVLHAVARQTPEPVEKQIAGLGTGAFPTCTTCRCTSVVDILLGHMPTTAADNRMCMPGRGLH